MIDLEDSLSQGIPLGEAASFLVRLRGTDKVAMSPGALDAALAALPEDERRALVKGATALHLSTSAPGRVKRANEVMPMQLPPTGQGQVMKPPTPAPLPATATGQNAKMAAEKKFDAFGYRPLDKGTYEHTSGSKWSVVPEDVAQKHHAKGHKVVYTEAGHFIVPADKVKMAESEEDKGKARGRAATAAHFERDKHRSREKNRELAGRIGGAASLGGAVHRFSKKKNPLSALVAGALGSHLGGRAGKRSGQVADAKAWERKHAEALKEAFDTLEMPTGNPQQGAPPPFAQPGQPAQPGKPAAGPPPVNTPPPGAIEPIIDPETQAFLEQEQAADAEAEEAHVEMLRQKLQEAQTELQSAQQQSETLQQAQTQHDSTLQQMQAQVSDSFQQSAAAQDEVLKQQQSAAAMRMAFQQLRGKVLELAASDPPTLSPDAQAIMAAQAAPTAGAPAPQQGPAGQAPSPGAAPGAAPPAGEEAVNQNAAGQSSDPAGESSPSGEKGQKDQPESGKSGKDSKVSLKIGAAAMAAVLKEASLKDMFAQYGRQALARLPHAAAGAAMGAGLGAGEAFTSNEPLRQKVQGLEGKQERGLRDTLDLAQARARLTVGEFGEKHPGAMVGAGALGGALLGAQHGPSVVQAGRDTAQAGGDIAKKIKLLITKGAA